ncbi:hypothetical protein [Acuticoccus mangrovi]|uniref:Uncharacterized protein n=1 Tax=Acuticoccus mangrovi TaxID=2796142 RepID=A0A934INT3_9HYPH|nr:hypothetical protein [Acuticoccus mangrovi]MBJ3778321.1 hypothetical protein [Acuticoccus mangrovi]
MVEVEERTATEARQGERDNRILRVLVISITVAAVLAVVGYFYVFAEDDADLAKPTPAVETTDGPATSAQ